MRKGVVSCVDVGSTGFKGIGWADKATSLMYGRSSWRRMRSAMAVLQDLQALIRPRTSNGGMR